MCCVHNYQKGTFHVELPVVNLNVQNQLKIRVPDTLLCACWGSTWTLRKENRLMDMKDATLILTTSTADSHGVCATGPREVPNIVSDGSNVGRVGMTGARVGLTGSLILYFTIIFL